LDRVANYATHWKKEREREGGGGKMGEGERREDNRT
jgi:hypothetical protein